MDPEGTLLEDFETPLSQTFPEDVDCSESPYLSSCLVRVYVTDRSSAVLCRLRAYPLVAASRRPRRPPPLLLLRELPGVAVLARDVLLRGPPRHAHLLGRRRGGRRDAAVLRGRRGATLRLRHALRRGSAGQRYHYDRRRRRTVENVKLLSPS